MSLSPVATKILDQMGGSPMLKMMTGAALSDIAEGRGLRIRLPVGLQTKHGVNLVDIVLNTSTDTYELTFMQVDELGQENVIYETDDIYNDVLQEVFERHTGIYVHL